MRSCQTVVHSGSTTARSCQQRAGFAVASCLRRCLAFLFYHSIPAGAQWCLIVVWLAFPLWLLMWGILSCAYLPFCMSSLERDLCKSFAHFKIGLFVLLLLSCYDFWILCSDMLCLYILGSRPLSDIWFENICACFVGCLFTFMIMPFDPQKFLNLMKSNLLFLWLLMLSIGIIYRAWFLMAA